MARFNGLRVAVLCLALIHTDLVCAFWRLACSVSQESRIDPIINPGGISGHVHKFAGGINVGASSTGDNLQTSTCSTCQVQEDKSAYWTPSMYYQHPDGTIESVPNDGMTVYYVGRGGNVSNTQPFPPGFRMVSGDPKLRHYDTNALTYNDVRPIADRVSFRCINEADNGPDPHNIDQTNCLNGLRAQINFQSCWDGQNPYLADNSHVAYTSGIDYGDCPPTHPIPIPGLFYEVLYWVNDINQQPGGRFVLSNGDPTGYSFHADFINGWTQNVLEGAVQNCLYTDDGGVVQACAALAPSDDIDFSRTCLQAPDVINEPIRGNLTTLPGCNPVTTDEGIAAHPSCGSSVNSTSSTTSQTINTTAQSTISAPTNSANSTIALSTIQSPPSALTTSANLSIAFTSSSLLLPSSTSQSTNSSSPSLSTSVVVLDLSTSAPSSVSMSDFSLTTLITIPSSARMTTLPPTITSSALLSISSIPADSGTSPSTSLQISDTWSRPWEYGPMFSLPPSDPVPPRVLRKSRRQAYAFG